MPEARPAQLWKMPPIAKVYEALGAIGDNRVHLVDAQHASVTSSDGTRTYQVESSADHREISSNDNASFWQGYLGYPPIAVMIARGLLEARADVVKALSGIQWKKLNTRFRNDYERTLAEVNLHLEQQGFDPAVIHAEADAVLVALKRYAPRRGSRTRPPRGK
jgi:hypothetical protein